MPYQIQVPVLPETLAKLSLAAEQLEHRALSEFQRGHYEDYLSLGMAAMDMRVTFRRAKDAVDAAGDLCLYESTAVQFCAAISECYQLIDQREEPDVMNLRKRIERELKIW